MSIAFCAVELLIHAKAFQYLYYKSWTLTHEGHYQNISTTWMSEYSSTIRMTNPLHQIYMPV